MAARYDLHLIFPVFVKHEGECFARRRKGAKEDARAIALALPAICVMHVSDHYKAVVSDWALYDNAGTVRVLLEWTP